MELNEKDVDILCKKLRETNYDTSILDIFSKNIKNTLVAASKIAENKSNKTSKKINHPLAISVLNHFLGEKVIVNQISGVGELSYFIDKVSDRKIYLFSDWTHGLHNACLTLDSIQFHLYMKKLLNNSDKFIDFYCEYGKTSRNIDDSYLRRTELEFRECSEGNENRFLTEKCNKNTRIHFTDIRNIENYDNPLILPFKNINWKWTKPLIKTYVNEIDKYINILSNNEAFIKHVKTQISLNKMVKKELERTDNKMANIIINSVYNHAYNDMMSRLKPFKSNNYNILLEYKNNILKGGFSRKKMMDNPLYDHYYYIISSAYVFLMDIYTLARMFKKHDVKNSYDPPYAKNIIVYAGAAHTKFYQRFLYENNFIEKYHKEFTPFSSCLDISDIKQPLFS